jgi:MarR-like DNA-binding transcriptional regulator SgrR of sgrS sRNA
MRGDEEAQGERNILRVGYMREIESLNPNVIWSVQAYEVMNLNYSYLMSWDEDLKCYT